MQNISQESKENRLDDLSAEPAETGSDLPRYLDKRDPECWYFRCSKVILLPIFFVVIIPVIVAFFNSWIILLYPLIITMILLFTLKKAFRTPTFDFRSKCYYCDWKKPRYGDVSTLRDYMPFSRIIGIQLLSKVVYGSKGSSHTAYEINLVSDDGTRTTAAILRDCKKSALYAKEIAEKLELPLSENIHNKAPVKRTPLWVGILCLIMFGASGIMGFTVGFVQPLMRSLEAQSWIKTPAVVTSSKLLSKKQRSKHSSYTIYLADINYRYNFQGRIYTGKRYDFINSYSQLRSSQIKLLKRYPVGKHTVCFVNPAAPHKAILDRDISIWGLFKKSLPGLLFCTMGVVVFMVIFYKWKNQ